MSICPAYAIEGGGWHEWNRKLHRLPAGNRGCRRSASLDTRPGVVCPQRAAARRNTTLAVRLRAGDLGRLDPHDASVAGLVSTLGLDRRAASQRRPATEVGAPANELEEVLLAAALVARGLADGLQLGPFGAREACQAKKDRGREQKNKNLHANSDRTTSPRLIHIIQNGDEEVQADGGCNNGPA